MAMLSPRSRRAPPPTPPIPPPPPGTRVPPPGTRLPPPLHPDLSFATEMTLCILFGGYGVAIVSTSFFSAVAAGDVMTTKVFLFALGCVIMGCYGAWDDVKSLRKDAAAYWVTLGNPDHFGLHAPVVIGSFFIFGSAPLMFDFYYTRVHGGKSSFVGVAIISFISMSLLSLAKWYVEPPPTPPMMYLHILFEGLKKAFTLPLCGSILGLFFFQMLYLLFPNMSRE